MNCAFFDGQSTVPQVHIPQTDLDLHGSLTWTFLTTLFATIVPVLVDDVGEGLVEDDEDDVDANEFGRHPFSTGRHPLRRA